MDDRYECQYCKSYFVNKSNLNRHLRTNVRCLQRRNKDVSLIACKYCEKSFVHKTNLNLHFQTCKIKENTILNEERSKKMSHKCLELKDQNSNLRKTNRSQIREIRKLENRVEKLERENESQRDKILELDGTITGLKTAPDKRTIYNTNSVYVHPKLINLPINNVPALTDEYVIERVNDGILTYEKAARGYPGILEVICDLITHENSDGIVERNYVCTDVSRNSFHRLLASKKWRPDKGGRYLNSILDTLRDVMEEYKNKAYEIYDKTSHESIEWGQIDWERKNVSLVYSGVVCNEGTLDREELINILRREISKRASV